FERLTPIIIILLISGSYLLYKEKSKVQQTTIIAKDAIIKHLKQDKSDSALLSASDKLKALDSDTGRDSLINEIK
ncbi:hypothetical protein M3M33_17400, partial [Loigolactobacillus coryniformis]|uniref:hypothetical protein n=1 Tax=Loigolactobacillus coryniformis TaxID=1610 RepID=UPI00201B2AE1